MGTVVNLTQLGVREARKEIIVGRPRAVKNALLQIGGELGATKLIGTKIDLNGDARINMIQQFLRDEVETLRQYANDYGYKDLAAALGPVPIGKIPPITVVLEPDITPCANAAAGQAPKITICLGYLLNISAKETLLSTEDLSRFEDAQFSGEKTTSIVHEVIMNRMAAMLNELGSMSSIFEFREALLFSLGHELAHIWLDSELDESQQVREVRADSVGLYLAASVSPAVQRKAELEAEFRRTFSLELDDPIDISLFWAALGPETVFKSFLTYCFEQTCLKSDNPDHLPLNVRLERSSAEARKMVDKVVAQTSDTDIVKNLMLRNLKAALLGL